MRMAAKKKIDISVIIPCRNEEKHIGMTIDRIANQTGAGKIFNYEALFIDGCSEDNTVEIIKSRSIIYKFIRLLQNPLRITACAFNIGIMNSRGHYICIIGAHAEIAGDYLLSCLNTIKLTDADNVGGPWIAYGYSYKARAIALAFQSPFSSGGARSHRASYNGIVGSAWGGFYKREVFDRIGFFDEELVKNQDDELNYRLTKSGGKIWQSTLIKFRYICRDGLGSLFKQYFQYGYWRIKVIRKHKIPSSIRQIAPGIFIITISILIMMSLLSDAFLQSLIILTILYIAFILIASIAICSKIENIKFLPIMPFVLADFHFAYGLGSVKGAWDFIIRKK